ncbi:MAG: hypothetical protein IPK83_21660 [Planctomycetes bacterium]|nr:hypothetical protein [Planctomycetota bacterium]
MEDCTPQLGLATHPVYLYFYDGNGNVMQMVAWHDGDPDWYEAEPDEWVMPIITPGFVACNYEYDPYGGTLRADANFSVNNPFRFSTKYYDAQPSAAAEGERGLYYYGYRYYSPRLGRWVTRDPIGERGGQNLYAFLKNKTPNSIDGLGNVVVLIHGVNADENNSHQPVWYPQAKAGLRAAWRETGDCPQEIIEIKWGDLHAGTAVLLSGRWEGNEKLGGPVTYATDDVGTIFETTKDRGYMIEAIVRMTQVLDELNQLQSKYPSDCESISVIAHSQGTIITLGALHTGVAIDNLIMMGSPLDVEDSKNDLTLAQSSIRGATYNYWSKQDKAARIKGGIGTHGNLLAQDPAFNWITQREFYGGAVHNGYTIPEGIDWNGHDVHISVPGIFRKVHATDLGLRRNCCCSMSRDPSISLIHTLARGGW